MNNIYNRYIWLLHTVYQERKVTFERLCEIWKHHFLYNGKPLSLRTFHHHRKMIEENFDIVIACNRKDYTYYIQNLDEILGDSCRNWLFNSRIIDVALKSSPCLFHRVVLPDMSGYLMDSMIFKILCNSICLSWLSASCLPWSEHECSHVQSLPLLTEQIS